MNGKSAVVLFLACVALVFAPVPSELYAENPLATLSGDNLKTA